MSDAPTEVMPGGTPTQQAPSGGTFAKLRLKKEKDSAAEAKAASKKAKTPRVPRDGDVRHVRLKLVYIDFISAIKMSFLVGVAQAIIVIVGTILLYLVFVQTGIFSRANSVVGQVLGGNRFDIQSIMSFGQTVAFAIIVAILNLIVITVLGAIFAAIYNAAAKIAGGLKIGFVSQ